MAVGPDAVRNNTADTRLLEPMETRMEQEQPELARKTFPAKHEVNTFPETEVVQSVSATPPRQIGGEGTVSGEYFFQNRRVRTIVKDGETWFYASDVCEVLEHSNPRRQLIVLRGMRRA